MIYSWQKQLWKDLVERVERLPHALLFAGPAGSGKAQFAEAFVARILCEQPGAGETEGFACGQCQACGWYANGNHPDFRLITPESAQAAASDAEANSGAEA